MTSEEQVYVWTKQIFRRYGWSLLASDPPRGTDVPRLEIKQPGRVQSIKKNQNSIINDLVYCKDGWLALVECKDNSQKIDMDIEKLERLKENKPWRESLISAMSNRSLLSQDCSPTPEDIKTGGSIIPVLAYPGRQRLELPEFIQITFEDGDGCISVGSEIPDTIFTER